MKKCLTTVGKFLNHWTWLFWPYVGWLIVMTGIVILIITDSMEDEVCAH